MSDLRAIVGRVLNIAPERVTDSLKRGDGEWDSFNHLVLIAEVEKELNLSFRVEDVPRIATYADLVRTVDQRAGKAPG